MVVNESSEGGQAGNHAYQRRGPPTKSEIAEEMAEDIRIMKATGESPREQIAGSDENNAAGHEDDVDARVVDDAF